MAVDLVVVGGGVAGLYAALSAADEADVLLLAKGPVAASNSWHAQGGVAAALADDDSSGAARRGHAARRSRALPRERGPRAHRGGAGADRRPRRGRRRVRRRPRPRGRPLASAASRTRTAPRRARRSRPRSRRACASTRASRSSRTSASSRCGRPTAAAPACSPTAARSTRARRCSRPGGYAALWERTTNPPGALGEGLALAYRAGAALADLEFVQFHPTALVDDGFLLSEALRGEGALLVDDHGGRFTDELAPRDVVARAIAERGAGRPRPARDRARALPGPDGDARARTATTRRTSRSPSRRRRTTRSAASSPTSTAARTLPGLYAAGESACTGVHGANRLASNSLLECLVFGRRAALAALGEPTAPRTSAPPQAPAPEPAVTPEIRRALWDEAGVIRTAAGLERLLDVARAAAAPRRRERARAAREPRRPLPLRLPDRGRRLRGPRRPPSRARARARVVELTAEALDRVVRTALAEDVGAGDRTTDGVVPRGPHAAAPSCCSRSRASPAGIDAARAVFAALDPGVRFEPAGRRRRARDRAARRRSPELEGPARAVLTGERTALNLLGRLSGIATLTARYVDRGRGHGRHDPRHAQDDAGPARAREVRRPLRRRREPPRRARRRDPRQGEPPAHRRRHRARGRRAPRTACRSRSRPRRSPTSPRRSRPASTGSCSTT